MKTIFKYYEMEYRASLEKALKTRKEITKDKFYSIRKKYIFYDYDDRIKSNRYILRNLKKDWGKYTKWLLEEMDIIK